MISSSIRLLDLMNLQESKSLILKSETAFLITRFQIQVSSILYIKMFSVSPVPQNENPLREKDFPSEEERSSSHLDADRKATEGG